MKIYDPTVSPQTRHYRRAAPLTELSGSRVGVLSNGKLNADRLLEITAAHFADKHACTVLPMRHKQNASGPAPNETLAALIEECDWLLTANGD